MGVSRIEELELNLSTEVFIDDDDDDDDDDQRYKDLPKLFQRMCFLRSLTINTTNKCFALGPNQIEADILEDDVRGSMEILIKTMFAVSQTLEVLCIKEGDTNRDSFEYLEPVTSLVHFSQMKYL